MKNRHIILIVLTLLSIIKLTAQRNSNFKLFSNKKNENTKLNFLNNQTTRSIEETKQSLDSIYSYEDGELAFKSTYTYNNEGLTLTEKDYSLNDVNVMEFNYSLDYTYNDGKLVELLVFEQDGDPNSSDYYKYIYTYNDGKLEQKLTQRLIEADSSWENYSKKDYVYTTNGYEVITSNFNNGNWVNSSKNLYVINNVDLVLEKSYYYWNLSITSWVPNHKTVNTYNDNNQNIISQQYNWNSSTNDWEISSYRNRNEYDNEDRLIKELDENFDETTSVWEIESQSEYQYNGDNNLISIIYFDSYNDDGDAVDLHPSSKTLATNYDNNYSYADLLIPKEFQDDDETIFFNHMLLNLNFYDWNESTSSWDDEGSVNLYYNPSEVANIGNITSLSYRIFPNPFQSEINFNINNTTKKMNLKLYDVQGRLVVEEQIENYKNIKIDKLKTGIYFYELTFKDNILKGKIIKE